MHGARGCFARQRARPEEDIALLVFLSLVLAVCLTIITGLVLRLACPAPGARPWPTRLRQPLHHRPR
jgi:hypothetical protein